jgi:predicted transcriptional regulator
MSGFNEAKIEILRLLEEFGPQTAQDVAFFRDRSETCCSTQLGNFYRWGLVDRYNIGGKQFLYSITERGIERLRYLEEEKLARAIQKLQNLKRCRIIRASSGEIIGYYYDVGDDSISDVEVIQKAFEKIM